MQTQFQRDYLGLVKKAFKSVPADPGPRPEWQMDLNPFTALQTAKTNAQNLDDWAKAGLARDQAIIHNALVGSSVGGAALGGLAGSGLGLLWRNQEQDPKKRSNAKVIVPGLLGAAAGGVASPILLQLAAIKAAQRIQPGSQ